MKRFESLTRFGIPKNNFVVPTTGRNQSAIGAKPSSHNMALVYRLLQTDAKFKTIFRLARGNFDSKIGPRAFGERHKGRLKIDFFLAEQSQLEPFTD